MRRRSSSQLSSRASAIVLGLFGLPFLAGTIGFFVAAFRFGLARRWYDATMCGIGSVVFGAVTVLIFVFAYHCFKSWRSERNQSSPGQ